MVIAGFAHLDPAETPPQPMILAATMLRIPGFDMMEHQTPEIW